jgi:hypothetical protein
MMGWTMTETCSAVNKRQDNKLENCCIWLVIYLNCHINCLKYLRMSLCLLFYIEYKSSRTIIGHLKDKFVYILLWPLFSIYWIDLVPLIGRRRQVSLKRTEQESVTSQKSSIPLAALRFIHFERRLFKHFSDIPTKICFHYTIFTDVLFKATFQQNLRYCRDSTKLSPFLLSV